MLEPVRPSKCKYGVFAQSMRLLECNLTSGQCGDVSMSAILLEAPGSCAIWQSRGKRPPVCRVWWCLRLACGVVHKKPLRKTRANARVELVSSTDHIFIVASEEPVTIIP